MFSTSSLRCFLEEKQKCLQKDQALKLFYILKAWRSLTIEDEIMYDNLIFPDVFDEEIDGNEFSKICTKLAKEHKVFELFLDQNIPLKKVQKKDLTMFVNEARHFLGFVTVHDAFFSILDKYSEYNISNQVAELGVGLLNGDCEKIYSPFSFSLNLSYYTSKKIYVESLSDEFIVELMKVVDNIVVDFVHTDTLESPTYINPVEKGLLQQFECVLSFPPMGRSLSPKVLELDSFNRFNIHKGKGNRDVAHIEHILAQTSSKAVVLVPLGMCYRSGVELELRKYLIENNLLESILQLPSNLNNATSLETTFFVINKHKKDDKVHFINLKNKQFLMREGRKTVLKNLDKILLIYNDKLEEENISKLILNQQIIDNSFFLNIDRYIVSKEESLLLDKLNCYELVELQSIADVKKSQLFKDEEIGWIRIIELGPSDLARAGFTFPDLNGKLKFIDKQEKKLKTYALKDMDIVISTKGTIGKVGLVRENPNTVASQAMHIIRVKNDENKGNDYFLNQTRVLYMYLKSDIGQTLLKQLVAGEAMPQITTADLKKLKIPVLSDEEIKQVWDKFSDEQDLYSDIDEKMNKINHIHSNFLSVK